MSTKHHFKLDVELREKVGKADTRRLRRLNKVPAVIYGLSRDPESIAIAQNKVLKLLNQEVIFSKILTLTRIGKKSQKVVLKSIQNHPFKPTIIHIDFLRVSPLKKIVVLVPLHFIGEENCPGVKAGGIPSHSMTEIEIKCFPESLPEFVEIDMETLELNQFLRLSDIKLPQGVELARPINNKQNYLVVGVYPAAKVAGVAREDNDEK